MASRLLTNWTNESTSDIYFATDELMNLFFCLIRIVFDKFSIGLSRRGICQLSEIIVLACMVWKTLLLRISLFGILHVMFMILRTLNLLFISCGTEQKWDECITI